MQKYPHPIKAVIFDNDGVIIDSLPIYRSVIREVIGFDFPPSLIEKIKGRSDIDVCRISVQELNLPITVEEFAAKRKEALLRELPKSNLIPGAEKIVRKMKEMGLPIALATSGDRAGQIAKASNHQKFYSLFDYIICGDEVEEAKPSPEIFLKAAGELGKMAPENILVIDDAPNGIIAANRAKMVPIMLHKGDVKYNDELQKPYMKIDCLDDFNYDLFTFDKNNML